MINSEKIGYIPLSNDENLKNLSLGEAVIKYSILYNFRKIETEKASSKIDKAVVNITEIHNQNEELKNKANDLHKQVVDIKQNFDKIVDNQTSTGQKIEEINQTAKRTGQVINAITPEIKKVQETQQIAFQFLDKLQHILNSIRKEQDVLIQRLKFMKIKSSYYLETALKIIKYIYSLLQRQFFNLKFFLSNLSFKNVAK